MMEEMFQHLSFGKHGPYVWAAWTAAIIVLAGIWAQTSIAAKRTKTALDQLRPKRPSNDTLVQSESDQ